MKHISVLIKPASSSCNIRCSYCFYNDISSLREVKTHGKMKSDLVERMIKNIFCDLEDGDELTLTFQGGEPTLAGLKYFEYLVSMVAHQPKKVEVHYAIQTNGTIINEAWCQFFKEHHFLVGLSIDGPAPYHDMTRLDRRQRGTFDRVIRTKELLDKFNIEYNVLCVLTNQLAKEPEKTFRFLQEQQINYIQFIPCLDDFETTGNGYALTPENFSFFYKKMFELWLNELENGSYISIKLFDDIFNLFVHRELSACGFVGQCQVQYVIEADGSVYPCDFFVLDQFRIGYIQDQTLKELFDQGTHREFLCNKPPLPAYCYTCPYILACNGGCKRMKDAMYVSKSNDHCGYQDLLKTYIPKIDTIFSAIRQMKKIEI